MKDSLTTIQELKNKVQKFVEEREWQQFHSPKNISMDIAAEAAELMELFLWCEGKDSQEILEKRRRDVEYEIADIAFAVFNFCLRHNIDLSSALDVKIQELGAKYPVEKSKGKTLKYNQL